MGRLSSFLVAFMAAAGGLASPANITARGLPDLPTSAFRDHMSFEAATAAAPVWLFGRSWNRNPCYPSDATNGKSGPDRGPNPGAGPPLGPLGADPNPGSCRAPPPWKGVYTRGDPFPNYIRASYCQAKDEWRITYSLYYVHDGALSQGHKHDWEDTTVVWQRRAPGADRWFPAGALLSGHGGRKWYRWQDLQTVDDPADQDESHGKMRAHPKVYVGFFKHANFHNKKTNINVYSAASPGNEFRSRDWWFMPTWPDMRYWKDIDEKWNYGKADSTPAKIDNCPW